MPNIIDKYARHAHYLEQYYNRVERGLNPFLNRVAKKLRLELTQTQTVNSAKRKQALLDFTESLMKAELTGFTDELTQQIELFSESEAEFAVNTLNKASDDIGMVLPTPNQLHAAVYARPFNNRLLKDYLKEFTSTQARQVRDAVSMGFFEGKPTSQIIQEIVGTKSQNYKNGILNVTRTSGGRMVRTALAHTAAVSKNRTFEQNIDITPYYEWVSVLDGRTSAICKSLDGNVYQVGKGRLPPAHPNCVLGDTFITSGLGVSSVFKRVFKGEVITINTVSGNKLTVTPNHPILTTNGWVAAKLLNIGDQCFTQRQVKGVLPVNSNNDSAFINAKDLFESFLTSSYMTTIKMKVSAPDFHNDAIDNEVAEVSSASNLSSIVNVGIVEHFGKVSFYLRNIRALSSLKSQISFNNLRFINGSASDSIIGGLNKFFSIACARAIHSCLLLFTPTSKDDAVFSKDSLYGSWADTKRICNSPDTYAGGVFADDIVSVERSYFSGHVYNLQTLDHCYSANGIITHNCRSTTSPLFKNEVNKTKDGLTRIGKDTGAGIHYNDWLKKQSKQFQVDTLGKTKADLFRKGGLSVDKFVNNRGQELTLDQLKEKYPTEYGKI